MTYERKALSRPPRVEQQFVDVLCGDGAIHRVCATPSGKVLVDFGIVVDGKVLS